MALRRNDPRPRLKLKSLASSGSVHDALASRNVPDYVPPRPTMKQARILDAPTLSLRKLMDPDKPDNPDRLALVIDLTAKFVTRRASAVKSGRTPKLQFALKELMAKWFAAEYMDNQKYWKPTASGGYYELRREADLYIVSRVLAHRSQDAEVEATARKVVNWLHLKFANQAAWSAFFGLDEFGSDNTVRVFGEVDWKDKAFGTHMVMRRNTVKVEPELVMVKDTSLQDAMASRFGR